MADFQNKKVLVTGAGRGFGREITKALVKEGAQVVALSRTKSHLDSLSQECPSIIPVCCDLSDLNSALECVKSHLPVHMLVNNAGIVKKAPFLEATHEDFDESIAINLKAPMFLSQLVGKSMVEHGIKGSIVHLSSRSSQTVIPGANLHVYSISKGGLDMLGKNIAVALGPYGIRSNCVNPTLVLTDMGMASWNDPARRKALTDTIPLRKLPEVEDVVNAVLFLLSDKSAMTTGATFPVEGGLFVQ